MARLTDIKKRLVQETDAQRKAIFKAVEQDDGSFVLKRARMGKPERKLRSFQLPKIILSQHLLTKKEADDHEWVILEDNSILKATIPGFKDYQYVCKINLEKLHELGLAEQFLELRAQLLEPGVAEAYKEFMGDTYTEKEGTVYELGLSHQPSHGPDTLQMGRLAKANKAKCNEIHNKALAIGSEVMKRMFPDMDLSKNVDGREDQWYQAASLTPGPEGNKTLSSVRVNFSDPNKGGEFKSGLKKFAGLHTDYGDSSTGFNTLMCMSHFDKGHYDGLFTIGPTRISTTMKPGDVFISSARLRHCATGKVLRFGTK